MRSDRAVHVHDRALRARDKALGVHDKLPTVVKKKSIKRDPWDLGCHKLTPNQPPLQVLLEEHFLNMMAFLNLILLNIALLLGLFGMLPSRDQILILL